MYPVVGHLLPAPNSFKLRFNDKKRQWEHYKFMEGISKRFNFIKSLNGNAAGHFLTQFNAKAADITTIKDNRSAITNIIETLDKEEKVIQNFEESISDERVNVKLRHNKYAQQVNQRQIGNIRDVREEILSVENKLEEILNYLTKKLRGFEPKQTAAQKQRRKKENRKKTKARKKKALFEKIVMTEILSHFNL